MKTYKITFNGTEDQLLLGATLNGFTGFKPKAPIIDEPIPDEPETIDEFMCRKLMSVSPEQFIRNAVQGIERKAGTDNYNAEEMMQAMLGLLTIEQM